MVNINVLFMHLLIKGVILHLWLFILMFGLPLFHLLKAIVGLLLLLTVFLVLLGCIYLNQKVKFFLVLSLFMQWFALSLIQILKFSVVTMALSILTRVLELFWMTMVFFFRRLVLVLHNKMELLNAKIVILLR